MTRDILALAIIFAISLAYTGTYQNAIAWEFGEFVPGDVYVYDICDYYTINRDTARLQLCYTMELAILAKGTSGSNDVSIAQSSITNSSAVGSLTSDYSIPDMQNDLVLIDDTTYEIRSVSSRYAADTIHNTLFWIYHKAYVSSIDAELGDEISVNKLYAPAIIDQHTEFFDGSEFRVSFNGDLVSGYLQFQDDIGLPVSGEMYIPQITRDKELFTFDLVSLVRGDTSNVDEVILDDIVDDNTDDVFDIFENNLDQEFVLSTNATNGATNDSVIIDDQLKDTSIIDIPLDDVSMDNILSNRTAISSDTPLESNDNSNDIGNDIDDISDTSLEKSIPDNNTLDSIQDVNSANRTISSQLDDTSQKSDIVQSTETQTDPELADYIINLVQNFVSDLHNTIESILP